MLPLDHKNHGRQPATLIVLLLIWSVLFAAYMLLDAAPVILVPLALFTLPALYDLLADPTAEFHLDNESLSWRAGRQQARISLCEIDHLRLDTRLDLSVRLSVVRPSGHKIRVPYPATPPHRAIEAAATAAGIPIKRHHFSLIG